MMARFDTSSNFPVATTQYRDEKVYYDCVAFPKLLITFTKEKVKSLCH